MKEFDVEEFANGYIRLDNGMTVTFKISWALNLPNNNTVSICGDKGGLTIGDDGLKLMTTQGVYQTDVIPRVFPILILSFQILPDIFTKWTTF